jgi:hypothetical protein
VLQQQTDAAQLDDETVHKIVRGNAEKLFGLDSTQRS